MMKNTAARMAACGLSFVAVMYAVAAFVRFDVLWAFGLTGGYAEGVRLFALVCFFVGAMIPIILRKD